MRSNNTSSDCSIVFYIAIVFAVACTENVQPKVVRPQSKTDSIEFKLWFNPSWAEASYVHIWKVNSVAMMEILINNDNRTDRQEDTFYYIQQSLPPALWSYVESAILSKSKTKIAFKDKIIMDGTSMGIYLNHKGDTNAIFLKSPEKKDSLEYHTAIAILENIQQLATDTLIKNYFDDVLPYIDRTRIRPRDHNRPLYKLRELKYNWKYPKK